MGLPTVLFIPGSFCPPTLYTNLTIALATRNINMTTIPLESVQRPEHQPPASMYDDAAAVAASITTLADEGQDIVLVAHSYGGVVATEAIKGLGKEQRKKDGKEGGVVRVGYLTAFAPREGMSTLDTRAEEYPPRGDDGSQIPGDDGYLYINHTVAGPQVFNDLPLSRALELVAEFRPHSAQSFQDKVTYVGYKDVPTSYFFCTDDLIIPPQLQRIQIKNIEESGSEVDVTEIVSGHFPSASHLDDVVDWIVDIADKCGE